MKDKILYLILGMLIGAIITAGCFLILKKNSKSDFKGGEFNKEMMQDFDSESSDSSKSGKGKGENKDSDSSSDSEQTSTDTESATE